MERDSETGNDHTLFRSYASNLGRWFSTDPVHGRPCTPQSFNRYAYVLDNPGTSVDPLGLCCSVFDTICHAFDPCNNPYFRESRPQCRCGPPPVFFPPPIPTGGGGGPGGGPGGGGGNSSTPPPPLFVTCDCELYFGTTRSGFLGCNYYCNCQNGHVWVASKRCNRVDGNANLPCPKEVFALCPTFSLGFACEITDPPDFCGVQKRHPTRIPR